MSKDTISVNMNVYDIPIVVEQLKKLEQENKQLKDSRDWWKDRFFGQQEYDDNHRITAIEYKKRIDKAIDWCDEIIRTFCEDDKQVVVAYEIKEILGDKENE